EVVQEQLALGDLRLVFVGDGGELGALGVGQGGQRFGLAETLHGAFVGAFHRGNQASPSPGDFFAAFLAGAFFFGASFASSAGASSTAGANSGAFSGTGGAAPRRSSGVLSISPASSGQPPDFWAWKMCR